MYNEKVGSIDISAICLVRGNNVGVVFTKVGVAKNFVRDYLVHDPPQPDVLDPPLRIMLLAVLRVMSILKK